LELSREPLGHSAKMVAQPSSLVRADQFGNVVRGRVSLKTADFSEIIYGVAGIAGAATNTQNKKPSAALPDLRQLMCAFFYSVGV